MVVDIADGTADARLGDVVAVTIREKKGDVDRYQFV